VLDSVILAATGNQPGGAGKRAWSKSQLVAFVSIVLVGGYVYLTKLTLVEWKNDEVGYRNAGRAYLRGDFSLNREHPFLAKYFYGVVDALVGDGSPGPVRALSGIAAVLTALVLVSLVRRVANIWAGLLAGFLWVVLPHPVQLGVRGDSVAPKLERLANLEAVMVLFLTLAMYAALVWVQDGSWQSAVAFGAAIGAAGATKAAAIIAVPALVGWCAWAAISQRRGLRAVGQAAVSASAALAVFVLPYAPDFGRAAGHVSAILSNASAQASGGHAVIVAGNLYESAPWWSLLYWQWAGQGTLVTLVLVATVAIAPWRRALSVSLTAFLLVSVALPLLWFSVFNGFALSHYVSIYQPQLAILSALVITDLVRRRGWQRRVGVALAVMMTVASATVTIGYVRNLAPQGYSGLEQARTLLPEDAVVAVSGNAFTVAAYLGDARVTGAPSDDVPVDAVLVDERQTVTAEVRAVLDQGDWAEVLRTPSATLYERIGRRSISY
jgi:hypothetical protein